MLKLKNLCKVMNKSLTVDIRDTKHRTAYYYGAVTRIPKEYGDYTVVDIREFSNFEYEIIITK